MVFTYWVKLSINDLNHEEHIYNTLLPIRLSIAEYTANFRDTRKNHYAVMLDYRP